MLLWHGYLLRGTGSNIYKANIVREWRDAGHDVLLMCQEREMDGLDFVDAHGDFNSGNDAYEAFDTQVGPSPGSVVVVRPFIGPILPVYVVDRYEGFIVKQYLDLTRDELAEYVDRNTEALTTAIEKFNPQAILVGHEVMGPYIAAQTRSRTGSSYTAQLHGSALEYVVKKSREYLQYAAHGLRNARAVVGGSNYMVQEAGAVIPGWSEKAHVVNPGCDVDLFRPLQSRDSNAPTVGYVGKFIAQKGVHNLLASFGLTSSQQFNAVIVGYGELDDELRRLWRALRTSSRDEISDFAERGEAATTAIKELLADGSFDEAYRARVSQVELHFPGRLEHGPLSRVLPTFDILVVPSIMAEAFGMVAAEAAAAGVLPIVPNHSGIGEVGSILESALDMRGILTFDSADPIRGIASAIDRILAIDRESRIEMGKVISAVANERWAWPTVARSLLAVTAGS